LVNESVESFSDTKRELKKLKLFLSVARAGFLVSGIQKQINK